MLLKNFVAAYQSLREACAISGPCTSTRTWSDFHCSPYLSQLTRCGRIQNEPSSVAWRPLSQLTHCGLKTNKPSSVKRILNVLRKKKNRKKVQLFVRQTIPNSSFITCLSQNYKTWQLRCNSDHFYSKYAFNMKVQKSTRQKHCRYMPNVQSRESYFHCCHNK